MIDAQFEFGKRYYQWALSDWKREIENDFPFLRSVKEKLVLKMMEALDSNQRSTLAKALVKRHQQPEILAQYGDTFTEEEKRFAQLYLEMVNGVVAGIVPLDDDTKKYYHDPKSLNRRKLKNRVITVLTPVLGEKYKNWGGREAWRYRTLIGPWELITYIDVGGRFHQLTYGHYIVAAETEHVRLAEAISLLSWLGISGQTDWEYLNDSDIQSTANTLAKICSHFLNTAPRLLEGLSPKSMATIDA